MRLLPIIALCACLAVPMPGQSIPKTDGTLLSGKPFVLPTDLTARRTILILGFDEKSAAGSSEWAKAARSRFAGTPSLAIYQLPVLASVPRLLRGVVVRSMKKELLPEFQETFLPVFENEWEWKQIVDFSAPDDAYVLLVDSKGSVLWKTHGVPTGERLQQLRELAAPSQ